MAAAELFEPHAFESGALEGCPDQVVSLRRGDGVVGAAAQPDRNLEKTAARLVGLIAFAQAVFVDSAEEKSAYADGSALGQHRSQNAAPFGSARKSGKGHGPPRALRPFFTNRLERGRQKSEAPLG
jgi:hypothetical protein